MARPRKLQTPVKLNLLIDQNSKDSAILIAAERKISVSRLFEALLYKEISGRLDNEEKPRIAESNSQKEGNEVPGHRLGVIDHAPKD
jgi:hypothetical protein